MDRKIVYPAAIPQETDVLAPQRYAVEAVGWLAQSVMGSAVTVEGMTVGPNSPAALNVIVQPGAIYAPLSLDATAYSTLGTDTRTVMQQGLLRDAVTLAITPPGTVGQSRVYVVQAACQVVDTDPGVLPYYNAADPTTAWSGPNNSGTPQNTRRAVQAVVSLKAGTAAATGSETAPTPDAGYVELARVTVANGATSITSGNIVANASLRQKVAALPDLRAMFGGTGLLGANGYMRLPGGLIVQWGNNSTEVGGNVNFAFPLTFPNACHIVLAMEASADGWGPGSCRVFGCNLKTQAGTIISSAVVTAGAVTFGSAAFFWIALGH
jgi:hypothetical protein